MQDRFRFKIWDKEQKRFFSFEDFKKYEVEFSFDPDTNEVLCEYNDARYVVIQCTGLKDKTGRLIYEGDIVKVLCNREDKGGLFYRPGLILYNITEKDEHGHADSSFYLKLGNDMCALFSKEKTEVIGNIYENPELLEVK